MIWLTQTALIFKNICRRVSRNQESVEGPSTTGKYSSNIFSAKSKQQFKKGLSLGPMLFSVFTGHLEKGEMGKLTKNTKLFRVVRSSINHEELQRNHV